MRNSQEVKRLMIQVKNYIKSVFKKGWQILAKHRWLKYLPLSIASVILLSSIGFFFLIYGGGLIVDEKKSYKFVVIYEKKDLDNTLKSLKINGEEYFRVGETKYSIKVPSNVTSIRIEAVLNDSENFKLDDTFDNGVKIHSFSGNSTGFTIEVVPVNDQVGASSLSYIIEVTKEGSSSVPPSSSKPSSSKPVTGDVDKNPQTGDISMFLMALILISSLVASVFLYQKNMEAYK